MENKDLVTFNSKLAQIFNPYYLDIGESTGYSEKSKKWKWELNDSQIDNHQVPTHQSTMSI